MPDASPKIRKKRKNTLPARFKRNLTQRLATFMRWASPKMNRGSFANIMMLSFIMCTSIGAGMVYPPAGWVVAGVTSGLFGFLLGLA